MKKYLIPLIILSIGILIYINIPIIKIIKEYNDENNKENINEILIENILNYNTDEFIDKDFLHWIYNKYGTATLKELYNVYKKNTYNINIWHDITGNSYIILKDLYRNKYENMNNIKIIDKKDTSTISFVGDVSLADNWYIMPKYDERRKGIYGILSEDTIKIMTESDIMVINSEFTISDRGEKMPGKYYSFRASPRRIPIYNEMGADLLTLANNHVFDFGDVAFNDMLDSLDGYQIPHIGAGKNINEAKKPYYFIINGYKISFVNATRAEKNILTPEATDNNGGVFRCYDPTALIDLIRNEKENSDYVIALIHWGCEDSHELEQVQIDTGKQYLDAGADVIIGTHAHVLQGIEFYNNKPIVYNLGDFIFNDETKDTGIFQIKLTNDGNMKYYFIPAYEENEYTRLLYDEEKQRVINNMNTWSINAIIDSDGLITQKDN